MPIPLILWGIAAVISIAATTVSFYYNYLTDEQKEEQEKLRSKINEFGPKFKDLENQFEGDPEALAKELYYKLKDEYVILINKFREEKKRVKDDLEIIKKAIFDSLNDEGITPFKKRALLIERNRVDDAVARLDAYWKYLEWYDEQFILIERNKNYSTITDLQTPQALLPEDYLYVGKLALINKNELNKSNGYSQTIELAQDRVNNIYTDKYEREYLNYFIENEIVDIPVFIKGQNKRYFRASISRGELYFSIIKGEAVEIEPKQSEKPNQTFLVVNYKNVRGILPREYKLYPLKRYREGDKIRGRVIENDFLLNQVTFSEKEIENEDQSEIYRIILIVDDALTEDKFKILDDNAATEEILIIKADLESEKKTIILKMGNAILNAQVNSNFLFIHDVSQEQVDSSNSFICPFGIILTKKDLFQSDFIFKQDEIFKRFLDFILKQQVYEKHSKSTQNKDLEFIRKWSEIIEYQINHNSYDLEELAYDSIQIESEIRGERKISFFEIRIRQELNSKFLKRFDQLPTIAVECKLKNDKEFSFIKIGQLDDFDDQRLILKVCFDLPQNDIVFSDRNILQIGYQLYPTALIRQRNALHDFSIGKIINHELKQIIISPHLVTHTDDEFWSTRVSTIAYQNEDLTENQKNIVKRILSEGNIFVLQGPPGSGKTTIIKELAYQFLRNSFNTKLLIVSQQNVAVDNALERIYLSNKELFDDGKKSFVRIGDVDKISEDLHQFTIDEWFINYKESVKKQASILDRNSQLSEFAGEWETLINKENFSSVDNEIIEVLINSHNIIGATCVGLANKKIGLNLIDFDLAIIDEAGRATPPELLIPMLRAKKIVLIGDHYQLPPQVDRKLIEKLQTDENDLTGFDLEFLERSYFEKIFNEIPDSNKDMLIEQYRMPVEIGKMISKLFYNGRLKNGVEENRSLFEKYLTSKSGWLDPERQIQWIDVKGLQSKEINSPFNELEVSEVISLLKNINENLIKRDLEKTVAVITPYSAQKRRIRSAYNKLHLERNKIKKIKIDTVDSFQGEEAQIVIYSTVRTRGNLSFLIDRRRLNVAISRTKENLFFVGNKSFLKNAKTEARENLFTQIIDYIDKLR